MPAVRELRRAGPKDYSGRILAQIAEGCQRESEGGREARLRGWIREQGESAVSGMARLGRRRAARGCRHAPDFQGLAGSLRLPRICRRA